MAYDYDDYYKRGAVRRNQEMENRRRMADPVRYQPVTSNGAVSTAGTNLDGTPESVFNRQRQTNLANIADSLANQGQRTANQGLAQQVAANRPGEQQRRAGLAQVLSQITPAQANPQYGQLARVIGADAPADTLLSRTIEGGNLAGDNRDYFLQTGRAQSPEAARSIFDQERQQMGRGSGVAMTESGKIIRVDPNNQYDVQQDIDNPELRNLVPQIAQANQQAISEPERKALLGKALEFSSMGIDLPEGADFDNLSQKDIQKMAVQAGKTQAQKEYNQNYLQMAKTLSGLKMTDEFGQERSLTPEQIHQQVMMSIGPPPGQQQQQQSGGNDVDQAIQLALGGGQPQVEAPPEAAAPSPSRGSNFNLANVIGGIRDTFTGGQAQAAMAPPAPAPNLAQTVAPPSMSRTAQVEGAGVESLPNIYEKFFGKQRRQPTFMGSVIG